MSELPPQPTKVCPKCSVQAQTSGEFCPHCGKSYVQGKSAKPLIFIIAGVVLLAVVGGGFAISLSLSNSRDAEAAEASESAASASANAEEAAAAKEAAAEERAAEEKAAGDALELEYRASTVKDLEQQVKKSAKEGVDDGYFTGPILSASCMAVGGGSTDDLDDKSTKFECLAIYEEHDDGTSSGYPYDATINWDDGSYTWIPQF